MRVYIVIASISPIENLCMLKSDVEPLETRILIVDEGDEKIRSLNDKLLANIPHEHYGPREREKWFKERFGEAFEKYLQLIPVKCHAETSFGFLKAYEEDADIIIELDDDVLIPDDFLRGHLDNLFNDKGVTVYASGKWYNTLENIQLNTNQKIFPRGHPYAPSCRNEGYEWVYSGGNCVLNMGLWSGHPDLDALTILYYGGLNGKCTVEGDACKRDKVILGNGTYFGLCSMNTSFMSKIVPAFYQLYMNFNDIDRFDDIWSGIFIKKIADQIGDKLCLGKPVGRHLKRARNVFKDLQKEANGLEINENLWKICDEAELSAKTYADCYLELADHIDKNIEKLVKTPSYVNFWQVQTANMRKWVDVIDKIS